MSTLKTARRFVQYHQRVLELDPVGYWLLDEKQGAVAYDWVTVHGLAASRSGTYVGPPTLGETGIGDGRAAPHYGGATDYVNVQTPSLTAAFPASTGTVGAWGRVDNWTDGQVGQLVRFSIDPNNLVTMYKDAVNNQVGWYYRAAGAAAQNPTRGGVSPTEFFLMSLTWDSTVAPTGEFRAFWNGVQEGATLVNVAALVGNVNNAFIGAGSAVPAFPWDGSIAHAFVLDYALPPDGHARLYEV